MALPARIEVIFWICRARSSAGFLGPRRRGWETPEKGGMRPRRTKVRIRILEFSAKRPNLERELWPKRTASDQIGGLADFHHLAYFEKYGGSEGLQLPVYEGLAKKLS